MYPLNFTDQEALAFSMLPSVSEQIQPLLPPGFDSAYEKVMATHHKERNRKTELMQDMAEVIQMGIPANRKEPSNLLFTIIQAILHQHTLQTTYHTQWRNEQSERNVDPYYILSSIIMALIVLHPNVKVYQKRSMTLSYGRGVMD